MKNLVIILLLFSSLGCAAGAATSGYAIKAGTADEIGTKARSGIINEIKEWANSKFQPK